MNCAARVGDPDYPVATQILRWQFGVWRSPRNGLPQLKLKI